MRRPVRIGLGQSITINKAQSCGHGFCAQPTGYGYEWCPTHQPPRFPYGFLSCPPFLNRWFRQRDANGRTDMSNDERLQMLSNRVEKTKSKMPEKDVAAIHSLELCRCALKSKRQGFARSFDGALLDGKLCYLDLGFKVEDIMPQRPFTWKTRHMRSSRSVGEKKY